MTTNTTDLEKNRCPHCHEFHNVDDEHTFSGSDHDLVQAQTIFECDRKQYPDEEIFQNNK